MRRGMNWTGFAGAAALCRDLGNGMFNPVARPQLKCLDGRVARHRAIAAKA